MKVFQLICFSLFSLLALDLSLPQAQAQVEQQSPSKVQIMLESTTWTGNDSEGDQYEFTFLKGGQIRYTVQIPGEEAVTYEDLGDVWAQNGAIVIILLSDYSTYLGTINGEFMNGKSWNVVGKRWTWELKKK